MDTIYITGHKNPDTDSIVSAMAYAALKNALGLREYKAARLGEISDETKTVLERFHAEPPLRISDVRTQVRDLDYDTPMALSPAATIRRAWTTMQADRISVMPVANDDGTLYGMLSAGDVANFDVSSVQEPYVHNIPVYNLLSVLEGRILNAGGENTDEISGEITIALPAGCENLIFSRPDSIVVCGDQPDMIRRALDIGVCCVIVCQAEVAPELLAMESRTCLISTPLDPYRAVRLICHALPIASICKSQDLVCFHLDDYIDDVRNTVLESRFRASPILASMYQEKGLMPSAKMAGLMAAAIISDTVMFKSPTCTQRDIDVANRMARIGNVSLDALGQMIFSGDRGGSKSVEELLQADYKEFHIAGHDIAVSQITCMDSEKLLERKEEFLSAMRGIRQEHSFNTVVLMITDVLLDGSQLLFVGDEDTIRQAFNLKGHDNCAFLPKVMSRKKQVIPTLSALWG